ncbi:MAG TPA: redoxin domain-containing protein [Gemmata sp.]|jgi:thiol-disulfide isomerase/thioredoxin|nr:redoxin domain-containing protein [Gemmata sp.]
MRQLLAIAVLAAFLAPVAADDPKPAKSEDKQLADKDKTLGVGDPAPALHATKWLQGTEVKEFAPNKVYVVEFWATWCGPCIVMMPHMSDLQAEYRDQGVTFVGFSAKDQNNTQEKVTAFVEKRGPKLGYTFAYADDRETYTAWMTAAKRNGIPCSFVVGKDGKIAYIGHPMYLDEVLPKVVAGKWTKEDAEGIEKVEAEVLAVFKAIGGTDAEAGANALLEFQKKHPKLAGIPYFVGPRISLLLKTKKVAEARKAAEEVIEKAIKRDDPTALSTMAGVLRSPAANNDKELLSLSLRAAEAGLKVAGDKDMFALLNLAETYFALGEKEKAREYGAKAVAASTGESDAMKKYVQAQVKKFDDEKKDK